MSDEKKQELKTFPILERRKLKESVPLAWVDQYREELQKNHSQSIETLARRGGCSYLELYFVASATKMNFKPTCSDLRMAEGWVLGNIHEWNTRADSKAVGNKCPQCQEQLIHTNTNNTKDGIDTYCENCGYPDENRLLEGYNNLEAEVERLKVELAVKPLLEATPLLNQSHMDELAQANTIIHLETEVARLKAQIHRMQNEEIDCMHDICAEREIAQNQCDEYKRLLGVARGALEYIHSKTRCNPQLWDTDGICMAIKKALAETGDNQ